MDSQTSLSSTTPQIKPSKYRWVILLIFCLISIINFMQLLQFAIIANILTKFYHVEDFLIDLTCMVFFISYIVFFLPISYLIEKYSLKFTVISATALTLAGNLLKLLAAKPDRISLILLAQILCAVGQVYISSVPSKLATTWFGSGEVSTACAVAVLGMQLGSALGCVLSTSLITNGTIEQIESQLFDTFLYAVIATSCIFVLVLVFFRSKPSLPPSKSQLDLLASDIVVDASFLRNMKEIAKNKNFWFIVVSLGLGNALWNAFGILINSIYLNYFPHGESDVGLITLLAIISGGCIGSVFFGFILDKTHHFKRTAFATLACSALVLIFVVLSLIGKSRVGSFISIPIFGFFLAPVLIIGYEYLVEITYPVPEECSSSTFNAAFYFLSIIATLLLEELINLIDYTWTFVVVFLILIFSAMMILLVNSDLKRRDANLGNTGANGGNENALHSSNSTSTIVTDARF